MDEALVSVISPHQLQTPHCKLKISEVIYSFETRFPPGYLDLTVAGRPKSGLFSKVGGTGVPSFYTASFNLLSSSLFAFCSGYRSTFLYG